MKNKILFALLVLSTVVAKAQNGNNKMTDKQKADAAKADVYVAGSRQKITDSFTAAAKDSLVAVKKSKKRSCSKHNKKSS